MNEEEKIYEEILEKIKVLDDLYENEYVTLEEYWKIKDRMIGRLSNVHSYYKDMIKEVNEDNINAEKI